MIRLREIATEILHKVISNDHNPISIRIVINLNQIPNGLQVVDEQLRVEYQGAIRIETSGKIGEVPWGCALMYLPVHPNPEPRMLSTEDKQLRGLMRNIANYLETLKLPARDYLIKWQLKPEDFDDKFVGHANLVTDQVIQASEDFSGFYCSIQIQRPLMPVNDLSTALRY